MLSREIVDSACGLLIAIGSASAGVQVCCDRATGTDCGNGASTVFHLRIVQKVANFYKQNSRCCPNADDINGAIITRDV